MKMYNKMENEFMKPKKLQYVYILKKYMKYKIPRYIIIASLKSHLKFID
ncbi:hypothetical protein UT300007_00330 [Clostridium sp. CTA-7]